MSGIFDVETPADFFGTVLRVYDRYQGNTEKKIEDLLYVLMGLNHLKDWIAPGYNHKNQPTRPEEAFYKEIWESPSFKIVNFLCNRTKHLSSLRETTSSSHNLLFDDWQDLDAVRNFDLGPASKYLIDGRDVTEIIDDVIAFYQTKWFERE